MYLLHLTLINFLLSLLSSDTHLGNTAKAAIPDAVKTEDINIILQSKDAGKTWEDISGGLPAIAAPEDFFASETDVYIRVNNKMYSSKNNLRTPIWEKDNTIDPRLTSMEFDPSGMVAFNENGMIYKKASSVGSWNPIYSNLKKSLVRNIFETSDGTVLVSCESGLYRSNDKGQSWKQVISHSWVMDLVESKGVIIGSTSHGIMRSTDNGENWKWVIHEGGNGIAVEKIDGGFAAISYNPGSETRRIRASFDGGKTWDAIDGGFPPSSTISSIKQIDGYLVCGHPNGIFRSGDMGKTWSSVHAGIQNSFTDSGKKWDLIPSTESRRVFKIYVSGNVLYAVARHSGC